jgi:probable H4MPT-linked C1 transfer pathway protein
MTIIADTVIGWDVGGVNIKAVRLECRDRKIKSFRAAIRPFEIWRNRDSLPMVLRDIGEELGLEDHQGLAVTMTAELSDVFRTKREGVCYVLNAFEQTFDKSPVYPFSLDGRFLNRDEARQSPLLCAATNWLASALFIAAHHPDCILMDIGSTTTDIIPIRGGRPNCQGGTDTQRLTCGELVYTGILRTNPNTVVNQAPVRGQPCRVAAEYFTSMADIYLLLGQIAPDQYTCPTADGRAKTIPAARDRLARLVCSDSETMSAKEVDTLACYLREKQLQQIIDSLFQVLSRLKNGFSLPLIVLGTGGFLGKEAARRLGMPVIEAKQKWGDKATACFPALAAAFLLAMNRFGKLDD